MIRARRLVLTRFFIPFLLFSPPRSFFDAGKNGDGIPEADSDEDPAETAAAEAEAMAEAEAAAKTSPEDWTAWVGLSGSG